MQRPLTLWQIYTLTDKVAFVSVRSLILKYDYERQQTEVLGEVFTGQQETERIQEICLGKQTKDRSFKRNKERERGLLIAEVSLSSTVADKEQLSQI